MTPPHPNLETIVRAALEAHRDGRFADADQLCREVLASAPNHPDALHLRGVIASDSGELKAAIELLRLAVAASPRRAQTHNSLGVALRRNGDLTEAIAEFRCAIELKPDYAEAFNNLGNALQLSGKAAEAVTCYRQALSVRPNDVDVRVNLSEALRRLDAIDEAEVVLREATDVDPLAAYPWYFLGRIARDRRQTSEAIARFRRYLERDPADEYGARLDLAALGAEAPAPAGASYIRSFYAERANTWDTTPDNPHYLGHDLILDVLREELRRHRDPAILDAGCGTGVLGERLRPYTRNLDGVDLSPHMVAKAREKRVYDRLACADLVDFLRVGFESHAVRANLRTRSMTEAA